MLYKIYLLWLNFLYGVKIGQCLNMSVTFKISLYNWNCPDQPLSFALTVGRCFKSSPLGKHLVKKNLNMRSYLKKINMEVNRTVICDEVKGTNVNGKNKKTKIILNKRLMGSIGHLSNCSVSIPIYIQVHYSSFT